jgi:hypothetical protein
MTLFEGIYEKRIAKVKQKRIRTGSQIQRLRDLRQTLIAKNLSGIYSDSDFKEQLGLIEEQLQNMAILSKETSLDKYNKESAKAYLESIVADIPRAYEACDIRQKRTFISLLFPKGLVWNYPGLTEKLN